MEPYGLGVMVLMEDLETEQQQAVYPHQSPHLLEEPTGNKFLLEVVIQQQSKLMEPYGFGVLVLSDNLETHK
jgi:hypothetical protein